MFARFDFGKKFAIPVKFCHCEHDVDSGTYAPLETELQNKGMATKTIATSLALTAFAIAVVAGLMAGNPASHVLKVAIFSMIVCHVLGVFVGMISEHAVSEYIVQARRANPMPDVVKETAKPLGDFAEEVIEV